MLTRKRWTPPNIPPTLAPEVQQYLRDQNKSISDYLLSLESPDSLTITEATIDGKVGTTSPDTGAFTTIDTSSYATINDSTIWGGLNASVAANADWDIPIGVNGSGLYVIRNSSDGGVLIASCDMATTIVTIISDPSAYGAVGADPGAGTSKFWLTVSSTNFRIRNRYAASKSIRILMLALGGTPA